MISAEERKVSEWRNISINRVWLGRLAFSVVVGCTVLNLALCLAYTLGVTVTQRSVISGEILLYLSAATLVLFSETSPRRRHVQLGLVVAAVVLMTLTLKASLDLKVIRDLLMLPIFVMLGALAVEMKPRWITLLLYLVLVIGLLEFLFPVAYGSAFRIIDYYVATRDWVANAGGNDDVLLFVNSFRPQGRMLGLIPDTYPRISSVFLEPISFGFFCSIVLAFLVATAGPGSYLRTSLNCGLILLFLLMADSRSGVVLCIFALGMAPILGRVPPIYSLLALPIAGLALLLGYAVLLQYQPGSEMTSRIQLTFSLVSGMSFLDLIGLGSGEGRFGDSGLAYIVVNTGVQGALALLLCISLSGGHTRASRMMANFSIGYFILISLVGSPFSVKTTPLLGFLLGYLSILKAAASADISRDGRRSEAGNCVGTSHR